jgi:hypothetical protein
MNNNLTPKEKDWLQKWKRREPQKGTQQWNDWWEEPNFQSFRSIFGIKK